MSNPLQISSRFDLLAELGRGSQGVVYRAFDRLEQRVVALKTLALRSPEGIFDLKTEFRSVAEVRHPNLVQLYELFADGGTAFFTMEYVDGDELPRCLYSLANDHRRINEAFGQLVAGVDALHRARRLHRDLKPSNVLLEADGRVVVLDFGLSSMLDPDSPEAHRDADLAGTFQYLAPEVMSGHPARPPADWYAIGLLLHEALLGRPAFTGTVGEVFVAKTRPFKADAGLGPFQGLVEGLLSPSPSERPTPFMLASAFGDVSVALPKVESFVGRETELGRLETARHRPGCRVVRVRGLGGVGKTTLISRFTRRLTAEGGLVLTSRCRPNETVAFEALDGVVDGLAGLMSPKVAAAIAPDELSALSRMFPLWSTFVQSADGRPDAHEYDPTDLRRAAMNGLMTVLRLLAEDREIAIFIDDVQWAGPDSLAMLEMLFGAPDAPAVMLVLSLRPEPIHVDDILERWSTEWSAVGTSFETIRVEALAPEDITSLVRSQLGESVRDEQFETRVKAESDGNPFLILELCRARRAAPSYDIDESPRSSLRQRILHLGEVPNRLLVTVALAGRPLSRGMILRFVEDERAADRAVGILLAEQLLSEAPGTRTAALDTYHDQIRDLLMADLSADEIRLGHARVADVLMDFGADARELVAHLLHAERMAEAVEQAETAATLCTENFEFERAVGFLRVALEHGRHSDAAHRGLRVRLAEGLANAGRSPEAAGEWRRLADDLDRAERYDALRRAAALLLGSGQLTEGYAVLDLVLRHVGMRLPRSSRQAFLKTAWVALLIGLRGIRLGPRRPNHVLEARADVFWDVSEMLSMCDTVTGALFQARNLLTCLRLGDPYRLARALGIEVAYRGALGIFSRGHTARIGALALEAAQAGGQPHGLGVAIGGYAVAQALEGAWRSGLQGCLQADEIYRTQCFGVTWERDTSETFIQTSLLRLGEFNQAHQRATRVLAGALDRGDLFIDTLITTTSLAFIKLVRDEPDEATRVIQDAIARWPSRGFQVPDAWASHRLIQVALYRGEGRHALESTRRYLRSLWRSMLIGLHEFRLDAHIDMARAALLSAQVAPSRKLLRIARGYTRRILMERSPWSRPFGLAMRGATEAAMGRLETALVSLEQASRGFAALEMRSDEAVVRLQRATLMGGEQAEKEAQGARAVLSSLGVVHPDRFAAMLVPMPP